MLMRFQTLMHEFLHSCSLSVTYLAFSRKRLFSKSQRIRVNNKFFSKRRGEKVNINNLNEMPMKRLLVFLGEIFLL